MKRKSFLIGMLSVVILLCLIGCRVGQIPDFAKDGIVNDPVRDTLFVYLPDFEDEKVEVKIRTNDVYFVGSEYVTNGKAFFDVRRLPTGHYTVWLEFGSFSFPQHFWHERAF